MTRPREPLRIGVVGCGSIAYWTHLRELRSMGSVRLVAAADPDPGARERAGRLTGLRVGDSPEALLARSDVDAVVIAAPTGLHASLAVAAAEAGKHFYLEKPIATTIPDARRVVDAVSAAGVVAAVGFNRRCHPAFEQARTLLGSGRLGPPRAVQMVFTEPAAPGGGPAWKRSRSLGGGVLLDLASHHVDLLRWILGSEPSSVSAGVEAGRFESDTAWLRLSFDDGVHALGYYSSAAGRADSVTFVCERGVLTADRFRPGVRLQVSRRLGYGVRRALTLPTAAGLAWRTRRWWRPSWESSYRRALSRFVAMCRTGGSGLATVADGYEALRAIIAAERAAAENLPQRLPSGDST